MRKKVNAIKKKLQMDLPLHFNNFANLETAFELI